jgi:hypothetical protein
VIGDQCRAEVKAPPLIVPRGEILREFEKLIEEKKLFGAAHDPAVIDGGEFDPKVVKKKGKGTRFLLRKVPSRARLLRLWTRLFRNAISPCDLFDALSARTHEFEHRENVLLFGRGWIIYDTEVFEEEENVGELTLNFASVRDPALGALAYLRGARLRVVRIEHIRLRAHRSGYASTLFRHYERLFRDLDFDEFRLSASLSVGKYYWAKEGFDFADASEIGQRKEDLRALAEEKGLPISGIEIDRLSHAYDFVGFKREVRIPVFRDAEGYYSLKADDRFREGALLPLGKAFLLSSPPWEGYKPIRADKQGRQ